MLLSRLGVFLGQSWSRKGDGYGSGSEDVLQRVLPVLVLCLEDHSGAVRAAAVSAIA